MLRASAALLQFTAIYESSPDLTAKAPYAFFLELDEVGILLDCGWDEDFSVSYLEKLKPYAERADAVLLSSPQLNACGALPYVLAHLKPNAFVGAATSTTKVGLHGLLNPFLYQYPGTAEFAVGHETYLLSVDSIYSAFRSVREPFGNKVVIPAKNSPIECCLHFASRMLGGYAWTIHYQIDEILYCPDYSTKASYSLKRFDVPTSPNIALIDTSSAEMKEAPRVNYEDQLQSLFKEVQHTLRSGCDVLIPVDAAGRGIEILNIFTHLLQERGGGRYKIVFAAVQANELLDKAATMTEAFQDGIILSESGLFSSVLRCQTASEVLLIEGPKLCIADGASLTYGVAAELLTYFLPLNSEGGQNLVIFPEKPIKDTNASSIINSVPDEMLTCSIRFRSALSREELEEYYLQVEEDVREKMHQHESSGLVTVNEAEDDDDDESPAAVESSAPQTSSSDAVTEGLYTTHSFKQSSKPPKHLQFAVLVQPTLLQQPNHSLDVSYGIPISDEEVVLMRKLGITKIISDAGPEELVLSNDAQREANLPSKISTQNLSLKREAKVLLSDLSGVSDGFSAAKGFFKANLSFAKKVVCLRGSTESFQLMSHLCRSEKTMKCGECVYFAQRDMSVKLDTSIFSYSVRLDSALEQQIPKSMKRVRESNSSGDWEIGWVDGCITSSRASNTSDFTLTAVTDPEGSAAYRKSEKLDRGSFFVGNVSLTSIRDATRRTSELNSELFQKAPLLVFEDGVCVRKSADGSVTIASLPTTSFFDVRQSIYNQFDQVI